MSNNTYKTERAADLKSAFQALHNDLKSLVLTCTMEFPKGSGGGLEFLADVMDLQTVVAGYTRELLVRLFQSSGTTGDNGVSSHRRAGEFLILWEKRGKLAKEESRSEKQIDAVIRKRVKSLLKQTRLLDEEKLRTIDRTEDIPEMLYYLSTLEESLCWYAARYIARLNGDLAKMESKKKGAGAPQ